MCGQCLFVLSSGCCMGEGIVTGGKEYQVKGSPLGKVDKMD